MFGLHIFKNFISLLFTIQVGKGIVFLQGPLATPREKNVSKTSAAQNTTGILETHLWFIHLDRKCSDKSLFKGSIFFLENGRSGTIWRKKGRWELDCERLVCHEQHGLYTDTIKGEPVEMTDVFQCREQTWKYHCFGKPTQAPLVRMFCRNLKQWSRAYVPHCRFKSTRFKDTTRQMKQSSQEKSKKEAETKRVFKENTWFHCAFLPVKMLSWVWLLSNTDPK